MQKKETDDADIPAGAARCGLDPGLGSKTVFQQLLLCVKETCLGLGSASLTLVYSWSLIQPLGLRVRSEKESGGNGPGEESVNR